MGRFWEDASGAGGDGRHAFCGGAGWLSGDCEAAGEAWASYLELEHVAFFAAA